MGLDFGSYPPLAWQTYDIDFTAARYDAAGKKTKLARCTVQFNGVPILDDVEILHSTPGAPARLGGARKSVPLLGTSSADSAMTRKDGANIGQEDGRIS
ncbi:MAG: hypothetical protein ACLQNE_35410 [Thermoguttaceae bacterium]|jgi:hypothetical protein